MKHFLKITFQLYVAALGLIFSCSAANAGGLVGDIINVVAPGAGTTLDNAHRNVKEAIPLYKEIEEYPSNVVNETLVQTGAPVLQELIARSRDDALRNGVQPIPPDIRHNLIGFLPDRVLNSARYRVQGGGDLTLQVNSIRYGDAQAITLDYVIVFKELNDALYNATLWAHELTHIDQYQRWGIRDFSIRYLRNHGSIEREAYDAQTRYMGWTAMKNTQNLASKDIPINNMNANRPIYNFSSGLASSTCSTMITTCSVNGSAPVGTPCWCNTNWGTPTGSLIPDNSTGITPPPPSANSCTTPQGSCALATPMSVGLQCYCFTQQGNFPGIAQQKSLGNACSTPAGTCGLATPLFSGNPCYCPSPMGPIWGRVP